MRLPLRGIERHPLYRWNRAPAKPLERGWYIAPALVGVIMVANLLLESERRLPRDLLAIPLTLLLILHSRLLLRVVLRAARAAAAELASPQRWEALVLTGIDARSFTLTLWWSTVRALLGEWSWLVLARALLLLSAGLVIAQAVLLIQPQYIPSTPLELAGPFDVLLALAGLITLTLVQLPYTAAVGVLAAISTRQHALTPVRAAALWLLITLGIPTALIFASLAGWSVLFNRSYSGVTEMWSRVVGPLLQCSGITIVDTGVVTTLIGLSPAGSNRWLVVPALLTGLLFYLVTTWAALRLSARALVRRGLLRADER